MNHRVNAIVWGWCILGTLVWTGLSFAAASVGMVTRLSGSASYTAAAKGKTIPLKPFMKLFNGDAIRLDDGGSLQVIYFDTGRKADYKGPADISVGQSGSKAAGETVLPDVVAREVKRISDIIDPSRAQYAGAAVVRGSGDDEAADPPPPVELEPSEQREINLARNTYESLAKEASDHDITPELFLFSVMADFDQYDEMNRLIEIMEKKQPDNPTISQLSQWLKDQM